MRHFGAVCGGVGKGGRWLLTGRHASLSALKSGVNELSVFTKVSPQEMIMQLLLGASA